MRKHIAVGDPPTTGGAVLPYDGASNKMNGNQVALIGGKVKCEACGKIGVIAKAGGPRRCGAGNGNEMALEGDLCICDCHPPPPIMSVVYHTSSYEDMATGNPAPILDRKYNQHFQIVHEQTGKPLKNHDYRILHNGEIIEGTTDDNGLTKIIHFDSASNIEIEY
ncbi:PAAR domain-containing protein [Hydromonas duriensis]|nr:PAAR domain-containing protein [Hydromonas duriensis]